jgi:hypothetical protein
MHCAWQQHDESSTPSPQKTQRLLTCNLHYEDGPLDAGQAADPFLAEHVESIRLCDTGA